MKKHHLFILLVALLIVASLAFPNPQKGSTEVPPVMYTIGNIDQVPSRIVEGDTVYIRTHMILQSNTPTEQQEMTIFLSKKNPGKADEVIKLDTSTHLIQGEGDDKPEPYYNLKPKYTAKPYYKIDQLPVGNYTLILKPINRAGSHTGPTSQIVPYQNTFEVVAKTDSKKVYEIRQGDNGT